VQPSTPLGPDQVNVFIYLFVYNHHKKFDAPWSLMSESAPPTLPSLLSQITSGDLTAVADVVAIFADSGDDLSILTSLATAVLEAISPSAWLDSPLGLDLFITACLPHQEVFATLAPLFSRADMHEFSQLAINLISANFLSNPVHLSSVLLFVASRAAQYNSAIYDYVIPTLYSSISVHASSPDFVRGIGPFARVVDFEPSATRAPLIATMRTAFCRLAAVLRSGQHCNFAFVHLLRFWAEFAFRDPRTADAFAQIARHSLTVDSSLRLNPFRLRVISILHEHGADLPCVAPLARIAEKAIYERGDSSEPFEWGELIVADPKVARNREYQERLFDAALEGLRGCLGQLARNIAFPEIAAVVVRSLGSVAENTAIGERAQTVKRFLVKIDKAVAWAEREREAIALKEGFNITEAGELQGESPFNK
jgi:hypothetical protein